MVGGICLGRLKGRWDNDGRGDAGVSSNDCVSIHLRAPGLLGDVRLQHGYAPFASLSSGVFSSGKS